MNMLITIIVYFQPESTTKFFLIQAAKEDIQFCFRKLVNYTQMQDEIEKAKPTGDLDTVFRKYCKYVRIFKLFSYNANYSKEGYKISTLIVTPISD